METVSRKSARRPGEETVNRQTTKYPYAAIVAAGVLALSGCVSIAPQEPVKNPPTMFRSDNVVAVEFLNPATVGLRCGERGTQAFGMPVFHPWPAAMAS